MVAHSKQQGFHVVEALIIAGVAVLVGFGAWRVWDANFNKGKQQASSQTSHTSTEVPAITAPKDLDTVSKAVDEIDVNTNLQDLDNLQKEIDSLQ